MSLYLEHFGLSEAPFRITPHTDFFFTGANRGPTLDALIYAITQEEGIVKVTGEVGSGKTTLCRMLLEKLPESVDTLYLANPLLSRDEILAAIADELAIPLTATATHSRIRALQDALVERYAAGRRVVLLIDEAHAMPAESLEEIRLLSNLESRSHKLLQIALFAQPELDTRLAANDLRQLRERITQHFTLAPLQQADVAGYLDFRLRTAGYRGPSPFTARAIGLIARHSAGLSRRINILADKALLAAYSGNRHLVDQAEVKCAVADAHFQPLEATAGRQWRVPAMLAAAALLGAGITAAWRPVASPQVTQPAALPATQTIAPTPAAPIEASSPTPDKPLLQQHLAALQPWLASAQPEAYFLQLYTTEAALAEEAEKFLVRARPLVDSGQLRAYRSSRSGRDRIGIIYGEYPSRESATAALRALPSELGQAKPYPRPVNRLLP